MPLIKSAIKKVRKDKVRTARNAVKSNALKKLIKSARKAPNAKNLSAVYSALDRAAKSHLIHRNKAARLKSRLSKLVKSSPAIKPTPKAAKKS